MVPYSKHVQGIYWGVGVLRRVYYVLCCGIFTRKTDWGDQGVWNGEAALELG